MDRKKRRSFEPALIVKILRRHLVEKVPISDLCDEYKILPTDFYRWQKRLFEEGEQVFLRASGGGDAELRRVSQERDEARARLERKHEVLSELMEEHVRLKKSLGES
jgi:transposase-like protein